MFFFFFSSRRRHTRSLRDWSSDVCSSDLLARDAPVVVVVEDLHWADASTLEEIGRASCRERVEISVVAVSLKKKRKRERREQAQRRAQGARFNMEYEARWRRFAISRVPPYFLVRRTTSFLIFFFFKQKTAYELST